MSPSELLSVTVVALLGGQPEPPLGLPLGPRAHPSRSRTRSPGCDCAVEFPCSADSRNHLTASASSSGTPLPFGIVDCQVIELRIGVPLLSGYAVCSCTACTPPGGSSALRKISQPSVTRQSVISSFDSVCDCPGRLPARPNVLAPATSCDGVESGTVAASSLTGAEHPTHRTVDQRACKQSLRHVLSPHANVRADYVSSPRSPAISLA